MYTGLDMTTTIASLCLSVHLYIYIYISATVRLHDGVPGFSLLPFEALDLKALDLTLDASKRI